jgi:hypothetical protein
LNFHDHTPSIGRERTGDRARVFASNGEKSRLLKAEKTHHLQRRVSALCDVSFEPIFYIFDGTTSAWDETRRQVRSQDLDRLHQRAGPTSVCGPVDLKTTASLPRRHQKGLDKPVERWVSTGTSRTTLRLYSLRCTARRSIQPIDPPNTIGNQNQLFTEW